MSKRNTFTTVALGALASVTGIGFGVSAASAQTAAPPPPPPPSVTTAWNGAPETREEDRRFHVSGRFMYDVAGTDADFSTPAGGAFVPGVRSYARRAFLGVDGRLTTHWRYNVKFDITFGSNGTAPNGQATIKADDLYLEYAGDWGSVFVGNGNWVSPMEDRDSSLNIPFNERSLMITAGGFGKKPGVGFLTNGGNWSFGAALQSSDGLEIADSAKAGNEPAFLISRFTYAPFFQQTPDGTQVLAFGVTGRYRDNGTAGGFSYNPSPLSNKVSNSDLGTSVGGFGQDVYIGGEAVFQWNAFGAEAEYGHFETQDGVSATADGYYVDVFYALTGESRRYNAADGSFGAVAPRRTLGSDGGIGHLMLSGRYEDFDATDSHFTGNKNEQTAYTVGLTWVPISHVKFQLNYSDTEIDYVAAANKDNSITATTLRTQFDW